MKSSVPVVAKWLLDRFGVVERSEGLLGDLEEERFAGRSLLWVWRQVLIAMATAVSADIWGHKLLALRAIAAGWIVEIAAQELYALAAQHSMDSRYGFLFGYGSVTGLLMLYIWPLWLGAAVTRMYRSGSAAMAAAYPLSIAIVMTLLLLLGFYRGPLIVFARTCAIYAALTSVGALVVPRRGSDARELPETGRRS